MRAPPLNVGMMIDMYVASMRHPACRLQIQKRSPGRSPNSIGNQKTVSRLCVENRMNDWLRRRPLGFGG
jgi:hypothetical protein